MSSMRPLICIIVLYLTTSGSVWSLLIGKFSRSTSLFQSQRSLRPVTNFRSSKALALSSEKAESILTLNEMTVNNKKTYCTCVSCKCAYWVTADQLGPTGRTKVLCKLCKSSWFQSVDKLMDVGDEHLLVPLPDDRIEQVRRCVVDKKVFRYWPKDKVSLFVGNLPLEYTEKELGELIAEYGIFQLQVIKDREGSSRGFAFVDLFTQEDADQMAREMNGFYIASDKALFVRPVTARPQSQGPSPVARPYTSSASSTAPRRNTGASAGTTVTENPLKAKKTWSKDKGVELVNQS